jgi:tetratricopeptide (TPR) repeat protein
MWCFWYRMPVRRRRFACDPQKLTEVELLDKYEFQIKTEQMEKLLKKKEYKAAAKIADSIDWRRVRNVGLLMNVSEIYENMERYEDCNEILNMAYDCSPIGRMIVYRMVEVAVKLQNFEEAIELYKEFTKIAPHDLGRYVLKYKIYQGRGSSIEDQIAILEEYKSREYQEQWAYELATLYYKEGMVSKCVEECDDLILWFSEGEYVVKAMELKMRIQPLTASQEEKYRQMVTDPKAEEIEVKPVNMDEFNTGNLQAALAESLRDFIREEQEEKHTEPVPAPWEQDDSEEDLQEAEIRQEIKGLAKTLEEETPVEKTVQKEPREEPVKEPAKESPAAREEKKAVSKNSPAVKEPETAPEMPTPVSLLRDTLKLPKFLGQDESGQLTFDMQENVLERQITGQMTIEDILNGWEEKKKVTEAAIAEAAKRDEEKRRERERLRATGELPELNTEVVPTLPEEIQRLIDEIEGKLPVRVHVEPIERETGEEKDKAAPEHEEKSEGNRLEETQDIATILEYTPMEQEPAPAGEGELWESFDDILDILEAKGFEEPLEEPEQKADIEAEETEEEEAAASPSPMMEQLEKALEEELGDIPPGQLSEEQKKLFAYFTSVRGMNQQLAELLEEDRMRKVQREDSLVGNIVITGEGGTGKSTLASDIVKALQKQRKAPGAKMAKVEAESLNGKNVSAVIKKLDGGALLIEKAGRLKTQTAIQLSHAMTRKTGGLLVILEDEKDEIRELFIRCESLGAKFTRTIEIPTFTNKELVAFGESYAREQECVLDEMAVLALYNQIGNRQTSDHLVNVAEVKELIDEAMERGEKKGLFGKRRKGRTDEFGNLILLEKDFE